LAEKNNCDATCPVSTSFFLRIVAEHTWEEFSRTGSTQDLAPFWRVIESSSPMAKKLNFDSGRFRPGPPLNFETLAFALGFLLL